MAVAVRPMQPGDLDAADQVLRLAFGTEFKLPDPMRFLGDGDLLRPRWRTNPRGCLVAVDEGELVGSVAVSDWGSVAVLGPLTVRTDYWNRGVARQLLPAALQAAHAGGARLVELFTHPNSPRHLRLYESEGFTSQNLIAIMAKAVEPQTHSGTLRLFSDLTPSQRSSALRACTAMTETAFDGLDLSGEVAAVQDQGLGDTVLVQEDAGGGLAGFAVCHHGPGSEAGSQTLAIKFSLAAGGADGSFLTLLRAAEALAARRGASRIQVSVNHARRRAYAMIKAEGYRCGLSGVAMRRSSGGSYDTSDLLLTEEWR